jgi:hypothetical protein
MTLILQAKDADLAGTKVPQLLVGPIQDYAGAH